MRVIAFSQYLAYRVGGAEEALVELLRKKAAEGYEITVVSFSKLSYYKVVPQLQQFPKEWNVLLLARPFNFSFFPYLEYQLNRIAFRKQIQSITGDMLIASSLYAPSAVASFQGKQTAIYIQSEGELGIANNYNSGFLRWLKYFYLLLEWPFRLLYKLELKRIFLKANCTLICNSQFTASLLNRLFHRTADEIIYPINIPNSFQEEYLIAKNSVEQKGIVFVGDTVHKGLRIMESLAEALPQETFYHFSRQAKEVTQKGNIIQLTWQTNPIHVYKYAKLVIVPSLCQETFGRVARESYTLGIPVLASKIGGLPEAVFYEEDSLVTEFRNPAAWLEKIKKQLDSNV